MVAVKVSAAERREATKRYERSIKEPVEIKICHCWSFVRKYLLPVFGEMTLRDLSALTLQKYFSGLAASKLSPETVLKIKEVLSAVLSSAVPYELLIKKPHAGRRNTTKYRTPK